MLLLRILAVVAVIAVGGGVLGYFLTGQSRYLGFAWRTARYLLILALLLFALMGLERLAIIPL